MEESPQSVRTVLQRCSEGDLLMMNCSTCDNKEFRDCPKKPGLLDSLTYTGQNSLSYCKVRRDWCGMIFSIEELRRMDKGAIVCDFYKRAKGQQSLTVFT
jgi:hypothetical protein